MENKQSAPNININKQENFKLFLDNNPKNPEYIIEINLLSDKINIQAVKNVLNNISFLNHLLIMIHLLK